MSTGSHPRSLCVVPRTSEHTIFNERHTDGAVGRGEDVRRTKLIISIAKGVVFYHKIADNALRSLLTNTAVNLFNNNTKRRNDEIKKYVVASS